jgi:hypothetical protein
MTKAEFHSFIKLVRKMHCAQQECYKERMMNSNSIAKARALEGKVTDNLVKIKGKREEYYDWQELFIRRVKELRSEQAMYYATRYPAVLERCKEKEASLAKAFEYIDLHAPEIFEKPAEQSKLEFK